MSRMTLGSGFGLSALFAGLLVTLLGLILARATNTGGTCRRRQRRAAPPRIR